MLLGESFKLRVFSCCCAFAIIILCCAQLSLAHPLLQGALTVSVASDQVVIKARVTQEEVAVTNQATTADAPPGPWAATGLAQYEQHAAYLAAHIHVIADGKELPGGIAKVTPPDDPTRGDAQANYDLLYPLPPNSHPQKIELREDVMSEVHFAPGAAWQTSYVVRIGMQGHATIDGLLLSNDHPVVFRCNWSAGDAQQDASLSRLALFRDYFVHGVRHILTGYDHLLFISALVLAATTLWDLVKVVTAFTLAHTLTLTLAALRLVHLPEHVVEPLISASIVFVALQNVFWPKNSRGVVRLAAAFFFGLFHGLGFAGGLLEAMQEMHGSTIVLAILAFSLGVEAGHQMVVIPLFSTLKLIRHTREDAVAKERFSMAVQRLGSVAISVAGLFYLFIALRPSFGGTP
jgi:hydrogenase/urease accessory protein HupE